MKATQMLHNLGPSIWLDNITRDLLDSAMLKRYIDDLSVTGSTSNPTIFDHAITHSKSYDPEIRRLVGTGFSGEALFFELAVQDLTRAADLFAPVYERTAGVDGWVSLEVSPLLAYDAKATMPRRQHFTRRPTAKPVHQNSRHQGRGACDRRCDLFGRAGERSARERSRQAGDRHRPASLRRILRRTLEQGGAQPRT